MIGESSTILVETQRNVDLPNLWGCVGRRAFCRFVFKFKIIFCFTRVPITTRELSTYEIISNPFEFSWTREKKSATCALGRSRLDWRHMGGSRQLNPPSLAAMAAGKVELVFGSLPTTERFLNKFQKVNFDLCFVLDATCLDPHHNRWTLINKIQKFPSVLWHRAFQRQLTNTSRRQQRRGLCLLSFALGGQVFHLSDAVKKMFIPNISNNNQKKRRHFSNWEITNNGFSPRVTRTDTRPPMWRCATCGRLWRRIKNENKFLNCVFGPDHHAIVAFNKKPYALMASCCYRWEQFWKVTF